MTNNDADCPLGIDEDVTKKSGDRHGIGNGQRALNSLQLKVGRGLAVEFKDDFS
ncbi:hypothetical protein D3C75_1215630 [compost metagenome]